MCHHETLATLGPFQIQRCTSCGGLSVHLGATTVRLDEGALRTLHQALEKALERLEPHEPRLSLVGQRSPVPRSN